MSNQITKILTLTTAALLLTACGKGTGDLRDANYTNFLQTQSFYKGEQVIQKLENDSEGPFMHGDKHDADLKIVIGPGSLPSGTAGQARVVGGGKGCDITIGTYYTLESGVDPALFQVILLHEIGHCFGLDHSADPNDIMYAYVNQAKQGTPEARKRYLAQLGAIRHKEAFDNAMSKASIERPQTARNEENYEWPSQ